jgi:predicted ATPase
LEFLSQSLEDCRLLVLGAYRDVGLSRRHPLSETLGELARARGFHTVSLKGLDAEDVTLFIQKATGIAPSREFVEAIHSYTEGNPLFVTEVMRMLAQEGL